eukprot:3445318-Prymnesium_polylepis.1
MLRERRAQDQEPPTVTGCHRGVRLVGIRSWTAAIARKRHEACSLGSPGVSSAPRDRPHGVLLKKEILLARVQRTLFSANGKP